MTMRRLVDFPSLYSSDKIASLPSDELRAEYLWLLGVAGPHGAFEYTPRSLFAAAYAPTRDKSLADVQRYLEAFEAAGLLFCWNDEATGKAWAYFTGSEKPGRLPRDSWKQRYAKSKTLGPKPPESRLADYVAKHSRKKRELVTPAPCEKREEDVIVSVSELEGVSDSEVEVGKPRSGAPLDSFDVLSLKLPTKDGKYQLNASDLRDWEMLFPLVDVDQCLRSAKAWLEANPQKHKTAAGMSRFLVDWFKRESSGKKTKGGITHRENFETIDYTSGVPEHALRYEKGEYAQAEVKQ
jgi:hypothetical protein